MGRKSSFDKETKLIILLVLLFPIGIIYGIGKLIIYIANEVREYKKENIVEEEYLTPEMEVLKLNQQVDNEITQISNILKNSKYMNFDYISYYENKFMKLEYDSYKPRSKPTIKELKKEYKVMTPNYIFELISPNRKNIRLQQEKEVQDKLEKSLEEFDNIEKERIRKYLELKEEYENKIEKYNSDIIERKENYIKCDETEIEEVFEEFISSNLKETKYDTIFNCKFNSSTNTIVFEYEFPDIEDVVPEIKKYEYLKRKEEIREIEFSVTERKKIYEEFIFKLTLKIIDLAFHFDTKRIKNIIFNGKVYLLDPANGRYSYFNILSVKIPFESFKEIILDTVEARACLNHFEFRYVNSLTYSKNIVPFEIISNANIDMNRIDYNIDGFEFEHFSKDLLLADGFDNIEVTKASGDYGADIIAYKNDIKYAIQCKKYSNTVGVKAIQEVMGSKSIYNCHVAVVLTNNFFTEQAKKLAEKNNVLLWDRKKLEELIKKYNKTNV